jgi:hypothetical protein
MAEFTAALFATKERTPGQEHSLIAHALLFEGSRPCWEIHIGGMVFRFTPNPEFILEDGLWQLNLYCSIPKEEYKYDVNNNEPLTLEEEFGEEECAAERANISKELATKDIHFRLNTWPGVWMPNLENKLAAWQKEGVKINLAK